jgi:hypothetical protein
MHTPEMNRAALLPLSILPLLLLTAPVASQRTWVVDGLNRAGTDFTSLPPAAAGVADGDTVLVRSLGPSGIYLDPGTWTKAVTVLCEPQVVVLDGPSGGLVIKNVPAGKTFTWKGGLAEPLTVGTETVQVVSNSGRVVLDRVRCSSLSIQSSATVFVNDCDVRKTSQYGAAVVIGGCSVAFLTGCSIAGALGPWNSPGIKASWADVTVSQCTVTGGGKDGLGAGQSEPGIDFASGVTIRCSTLRVCGDAGASVASGTSLGVPAPAIRMAGGTLDRDPQVPLFGGVLLSGGAWDLVRSLTCVAAHGAPPGQTLGIATTTQVGSALAVYLGLPGDGVYVGFESLLWIEPSTLTLVGTTKSVQVPVPNNAALRGAKIAVQSLSAGTQYSLSNPAIVALD